MKPLSVQEKMTKARIALVLDNPFFGSLALRLKLEENKSIKTGRTNGKVIQYNPSWIDPMTTNQVKGFLAHEVMHLACKHHLRMKTRNDKLWNIATDCVIDLILRDNKFELPDYSHINECFKDMAAEAVYSVIFHENDQKKQEKQKKRTAAAGADCNGGSSNPDDKDQDQVQDQDSDDQDQTQDQDQNQDPDDQDPDNQDPDDQDPDDQDQDEDDDENSHTGNGDVFPPENEDGSELSKADEIAEENRWNIAVSQAAEHAKAVGKLPNNLESFAEALKEKKLDWKQVLREFVEAVCNDDYTWLRPNRLYLQSGFYLPSLFSETLGKIIVCLDTSGSITQHDLDHYATELTSILEDFNVEIDVYQVDTEIKGAVEVFTQDDLPIKLKLRGGGGTDFRPVFNQIEKEGEDPKALIYFTDLECNDYPKSIPDYPVLWIDTKRYPRFYYNGPPPFGETYAVNEEARR